MSIERGDLKPLVHNEIHIDEFESKLGKNRDVVVLSFKVAGKAPGQDICAFVERGYDWILDADVSSGEMNDGDYIVFVELPRDQDCVSQIMEINVSIRDYNGTQASVVEIPVSDSGVLSYEEKYLRGGG